MGWNILLVCPLMHYRLAGFGFLLLVCLGAGQAFEGCCFCEDRAFEKMKKKIGVFAFKFQTQEAQIVPDISLKCSVPFAIKTNRYSTYIIGTKWHLFQHEIPDTHVHKKETSPPKKSKQAQEAKETGATITTCTDYKQQANTDNERRGLSKRALQSGAGKTTRHRW